MSICCPSSQVSFCPQSSSAQPIRTQAPLVQPSLRRRVSIWNSIWTWCSKKGSSIRRAQGWYTSGKCFPVPLQGIPCFRPPCVSSPLLLHLHRATSESSISPPAWPLINVCWRDKPFFSCQANPWVVMKSLGWVSVYDEELMWWHCWLHRPGWHHWHSRCHWHTRQRRCPRQAGIVGIQCHSILAQLAPAGWHTRHTWHCRGCWQWCGLGGSGDY